jgi:WD40 repeat protein
MPNNTNKQVITLAEQEMIKIWDVDSRTCLNTIGGMIPHRLVSLSSDTTGRAIWHEATQTLLVSTYTELACVLMSRDNVTATHTSMELPISCTAYVLSLLLLKPFWLSGGTANLKLVADFISLSLRLDVPLQHRYIEEFNILASGDVGGNIICWDLSSGNKVIEYNMAHGAAVSCLVVCVGGKRLISGSSNGEIHIWGTLSGMLLQKLVKVNSVEVTGIFSTHDRIYTGGPVRVFRQKSSLEDAIGSHACSLEANMRVINGSSLGSSLLLPGCPINCIQTLKVGIERWSRFRRKTRLTLPASR